MLNCWSFVDISSKLILKNKCREFSWCNYINADINVDLYFRSADIIIF